MTLVAQEQAEDEQAEFGLAEFKLYFAFLAYLWTGTLAAEEQIEDARTDLTMPTELACPPGPPRLLRAPGPRTPPMAIHRPPPDFPMEAQRNAWSGAMQVQIEVGADGSVVNACIRHSSGHSVLDKAGVQAVRHWRFEPATGLDGKPVLGRVSVPLAFRNTEQ
jgi:TonB family C-terminal domain